MLIIHHLYTKTSEIHGYIFYVSKNTMQKPSWESDSCPVVIELRDYCNGYGFSSGSVVVFVVLFSIGPIRFETENDFKKKTRILHVITTIESWYFTNNNVYLFAKTSRHHPPSRVWSFSFFFTNPECVVSERDPTRFVSAKTGVCGGVCVWCEQCLRSRA